MSFEFFDGATQAGALLPGDLRPDPAGRFEILLGPQQRDGHWLQIVPGTSYLLSREFFTDWETAEPSVMRIECLDEPPAPWPVMSADRVAKELEALGTWLVETAGRSAAGQGDSAARQPVGSARQQAGERPAGHLPRLLGSGARRVPGR